MIGEYFNMKIEIFNGKDSKIILRSQNRLNTVIGDTSLGKSYIHELIVNSVKINLNGESIRTNQVSYIVPEYSTGLLNQGDLSNPEALVEKINNLGIRLIIFDDYGTDEFIKLIDTIVQSNQGIVIVVIYRSCQINLRFPIKKAKISKDLIEFEDYITKDEIIEANSLSPNLVSYNLIVTEDKNKNNKMFSDYGLWKESLSTVIQFYDKEINGVRGADSIYNLLGL
jgi:hypothetical protein